ncbi:MAG: hypothetical protein LBQ22_04005 [Bacteroidales bacterium]|jgi:hypothetical protein|nr:hypothetical protein [Bacteroidales bacterium]
MQHFAANYLFNGSKLIKNSYLSVDDNGIIRYVSKEGEATIERPRMIFYNGIISPYFITDKNDIASHKKSLDTLKKISFTQPEIPLVELLKLYISDFAETKKDTTTKILKKGIKSGIILIENLDLINLKLKDNTFVKILI